MKTSQVTSVVVEKKTCYRCGGELWTPGTRLCAGCRKPRVPRPDRPVSAELSFRERQIVEFICEARLNKEIAFAMGLTEGTVKEYLNRLYRKLEVKNRTQLAMWAVRNFQPAA